MGFKAEKIALEKAFTDAWAGRTPILYEEVPAPLPAGEYVKLFIVPGSGLRADLGTTQKLWRFFGTFFVDIVVPQGTGTNWARELADIVVDLFLGKEFEGVKVNRVASSHDAYHGKYIFKLAFDTRRDDYFD